MNDFITRKEAGQEVTLLRNAAFSSRMEERMLPEVRGPYFITPRLIYDQEGRCLSYDTGGRRSLERMLRDGSFDGRYIFRLFTAIYEAASEMSRYMLLEDNLCLDEERIYAGERKNELGFLPVPCMSPDRDGEHFRSGIRKLTEFLFRQADPEDAEGLRLLCLIYKASGETDFCAAKLCSVLGIGRRGDSEGDTEKDPWRYEDRKETIRAAAGENDSKVSPYAVPEEMYRTDAGPERPAEGVMRISAAEGTPREMIKLQEKKTKARALRTDSMPDPPGDVTDKKGDTIIRLLMAMGIMLLAAVIVIGLRGAEAFLRLLPIYLILCVLIASFILLGRLEKKAAKRKN